jgi:hypothetical protein
MRLEILPNQGSGDLAPHSGRRCRVISSVVVSYRVRPEAVAEHVRLIRAVFEQLHAEHPDNVEYKVVCLADGVSFVHVSSASTPDGSNPLPELAAFKEFGKDSGGRVTTPPVPTPADIIGSYYPAAPLSDLAPGTAPGRESDLPMAGGTGRAITRERRQGGVREP